MAVDLTIRGTIYSYPDSGDEPGWGDDATGWAEGVTEVLDDLQGVDDIPETIINLENDTTDSTDIPGFEFNPATVRSATVTYSIYRTTSDIEYAEKGTMEFIYKNGADEDEKWSYTRTTVGPDDAGITFLITDGGQVRYTSTNETGSDHLCNLVIEATVTQQ